jgi:hypothetical protein
MRKCTGLPEHGVDQGRLAVVDVSDDGDIAKIHVVDCRSVGTRSRKRSQRRKPGVKSSELAGVKAKKKCCRSKPRCKRCPLVLSKVAKAELLGIHGRELDKVFKRARKS